jgi:hypothetical protein
MRRTLFSLLTAALLAAAVITAVASSAVASSAVASSAVASSASAAVAAIPHHPNFESSGPFAWWNNGGFRVNNDEWNPAAGPQMIWANSSSDWGVKSDQAAGNTAVETYPAVKEDFGNVPVLSLPTITDGFTESMPNVAGLDAEAAVDVWLNNFGTEVMIWVDNHGQTPAGNIIAHVTISGQSFAVWQRGVTYTFALNGNETSGQANILASVQWLMQQGYVPGGSTLRQVDFGWEIASTGGSPQDFAVTNYWVHT